jgi:uncharacterized protein YneF (UPF0154 family)
MVAFVMLAIATASWASGPYDYASRWKAWDVNTRGAYVVGLSEGMVTAFSTTISNLTQKPPSQEQALIIKILKLGSGIDKTKIAEVMTDIYQDPANSYINTAKVFIYAQYKLEGKDISKFLEDARRKALMKPTIQNPPKRMKEEPV